MAKQSIGPALLHLLLTLVTVTTAIAAEADGEEPASNYHRSIEIGCDFSFYTGGLGEGYGQFLRFGLWRPAVHTLFFDVSRSQRFGDSGLGFGASYTRHLPDALDLTVAAGTGTSDFLDPEYRLHVGARRAFLSRDNLAVLAGYTRTQSKADNSTDGFSLGLLYYAGAHWMLGGNLQYDIGHPGDTTSTMYGLGATWYRYKDIYIGGGYTTGDVSYLIIDATDIRVDYPSEGWYIAASKWLSVRSGINLRFDHGTTSFYDVDGFRLSYFREF